MGDLFLVSEAQMRRIEGFFRCSTGSRGWMTGAMNYERCLRVSFAPDGLFQARRVAQALPETSRMDRSLPIVAETGQISNR
jgi:hypothetical protein